ncbi:MAG: hypothetical protein KBT20_01980 [Bacteroidales bacterium]|nr:hypothetical protein [Candidatus Liminaster caballi]
MKKLLFCIVAICMCLLSACDYRETKQQLVEVRSANDSLLQVTIEQQNDLADLVSTLNAASSKLDKINGQIAVNSDDQNLQNQKARLLQQLDNLEQQITEKQKLLTDMQKKYKGVLNENKELKKSIERMQNEIAGYQQRIAQYEATIAQQSEQINQLSSELTQTQQTLQQTEDVVAQQTETISQQDGALNRCYYIVAGKSVLKEMGLVDGGVFNKARLTTKGFDTSSFTEVDKRQIDEIELGSKGARLLSSAPESSYELVKGVDKKLTLRIIDKDAFWSLSKFLVVMID